MNTGTPRNFGKTTSSLKGWGVGGAGPPPVTGGIWEMVSLLPGAQPHSGVGQGPWSGWGLWPLLPWLPGASSSLEALGLEPGFEESSSNISGFSSISRMRGGIGPGISIFRVIALSAPTERSKEDWKSRSARRIGSACVEAHPVPHKRSQLRPATSRETSPSPFV